MFVHSFKEKKSHQRDRKALEDVTQRSCALSIHFQVVTKKIPSKMV